MTSRTPSILHVPFLRSMTRLRRFGAVLFIAASIFGSGPSSAHASSATAPSFEPSSCAEAPDAAPRVPLASAVFTPRSVDGGLRWDARFILDVDAAFDFRGGALAFAEPLPPGETLMTSALVPITEGDRLVGVCVPREALVDRTVSASFVQPIPSSGHFSFTLGAPLVAGNTVQIIETSLGDQRIEPVVSPPLEKHVGYVAPRAISDGAREEARRLTDVRAKVSSSPIYVRGDDVRAVGGLTARIVDPRTRARRSAAGVAIMFAALVGALVLAARKLGRSASVERADALLASEIDEAARSRPKGPG